VGQEEQKRIFCSIQQNRLYTEYEKGGKKGKGIFVSQR